MKIDIVIPWVDGNDPLLNEKRRAYADSSDLQRHDVGGATRYANVGEIHYCIRSINRFAPYINRIFIVTDGQDPQVESAIPVEIIDHKVIFESYEEYLPTFNSNSIETLIYRIPGLSEHFLLMNDDFFFVAPSVPEDFFTPDGKLVCYASLFPSLFEKILISLSRLRDDYRRSTFKGMLMNGSELQGRRHCFFFYLGHTPRALLKSPYEDFFGSHPHSIISNIKFRFRNPDQYEAQALEYMLLWDKGLCKVVNHKHHLLYLQHWKKGKSNIADRISRAESLPNLKFACFNSIDQADEEVRRFALDWLENRLK